MAEITSSVFCFVETKITFLEVEMIFKEDVITSSVANINYIVVEITFKVAVITSSVAKVIYVVNVGSYVIPWESVLFLVTYVFLVESFMLI